MAVLPIKIYPDPILKQICTEVTDIGTIEKQFIQDMAETMFKAPGVGLAAPQIGDSRRIIVVSLADEKNPNRFMALINPEITETDEEMVSAEEGCLSLPDYNADVKRHKRICVKFIDLKGNTNQIEAEDFMARVFQHEIDHLNGILFIEHLGRIKRDLAKRRLLKRAKRPE